MYQWDRGGAYGPTDGRPLFDSFAQFSASVPRDEPDFASRPGLREFRVSIRSDVAYETLVRRGPLGVACSAAPLFPCFWRILDFRHSSNTAPTERRGSDNGALAAKSVHGVSMDRSTRPVGRRLSGCSSCKRYLVVAAFPDTTHGFRYHTPIAGQ